MGLLLRKTACLNFAVDGRKSKTDCVTLLAGNVENYNKKKYRNNAYKSMNFVETYYTLGLHFEIIHDGKLSACVEP